MRSYHPTTREAKGDPMVWPHPQDVILSTKSIFMSTLGYRPFSIDGVSVCVRQGDILRLMADTVVYFWEMKVLESGK